MFMWRNKQILRIYEIFKIFVERNKFNQKPKTKSKYLEPFFSKSTGTNMTHTNGLKNNLRYRNKLK